MGNLALEGIRVVDFSWVVSGPYTAKMLADQGAEVIKIESERTARAFLRGMASYDMSAPLEHFDRGPVYDLDNRNKLSITLNLRTAEGVEIVKRLIKISDVVIENFSVKAMASLGLDYPVLREVNPRIVMISMAGFGHTGPLQHLVSHGPNLHAMYGLLEMSGYQDGPPVGPGFAYSDYASGVHGAFAILAALHHRSRTGEGQYIDLSQYDLGASLLGLPMLDYTANGRIPGRVGNRSPYAAPHGCYRCKGDDRWCTIVVSTEEQWRTFCRIIGDPEWTKDDKFSTHLNRVKNADELDRLVETWTIDHSPEEVMDMMQRAGVEAGIAQTTEDLMTRDPHMDERGFYEQVPHPVRDLVVLEGMPYKLSRTPASIRQPGPFPGEHNEYVYGELLGMSAEQICHYVETGVFR